MSDTSTATSRLIGEIFVERGLVTAEQLESALAMQLSTGDRLGEILVGHFGVPRLELASVLAEQWSDVDRGGGATQADEAEPVASAMPPSLEQVAREVEEIDRRPIGEIFVQGGFVTAEELERALAAQRETGQRLGEVLVAQGSITRLELASALAEQWAGLPKLRPPAPQAPTDGNGAPTPTPATDIAPSPVAPAPSPQVVRSDERLDELAARLDELGAHAVSSEEVGAIRRELGELAARPAGDPTLAARVDELALRLQAMGDVESLRATLAARVDELAVRVHEVGVLDGDVKALRAGIEELRAQSVVDIDARARLDALAADLRERAPASSAELAGPLSARLEELERRIEQAAGADDVRQAFGAVREEIREITSHIEDARDLESLIRRLDGIDARLSDSSEQHKVRTAIADLQAELAALGGRDERGRLDSVAERLDTLESGLPSASVLDTLRDDVAGLLARPTFDPSVLERVEELSARLEQQPELTGQLEDLRARVAAVVERSPADEHARERLDGLADEVRSLAARPVPEVDATLAPRLGELERRLAEAAGAQDVREAFGAVREEMREVAGRIEDLAPQADLAAELDALRAQLVELAAVPAVAPDETLALRLDELERRLAEAAGAQDVRDAFGAVREEMREVAGRIEDLAPQADLAAELDALRAQLVELAAVPAVAPDETLALRLDELERRLAEAAGAQDVRDAFGAVRAELGDVAAQIDRLSVLDGVDERLHALEHAAGDQAELDAVRTAMAALQIELAALSTHDHDGRLDAIEKRLAELSRANAETPALDILRADLELLRAQTVDQGARGGERDLALLRERVDQLEARDSDLEALDDLRRELHAITSRPQSDPALAARVDALATRLERLAEDSIASDDLSALRHVVAQLESRPSADPALTARVDELARGAETWQASAEGVQELRVLVAELDARPMPDLSLADRVETLAGRLDDVAATAALRVELNALGDSIARLEQKPEADPHLPARLGALSSRVDFLEPMSARVDELSLRVEELCARPPGDPALAGRLEELQRRLDESAGLAAAVDRIDDELELLRNRAEAGAASAASSASELESTLRARLDEAIAESRAHAETSGHEVGTRVDEVMTRLGALDELGRRADQLEAGSGAVRKELKALGKTVERQEATLAESVDRVTAEARAETERLSSAIEDLSLAATERDEQLRVLGEELGIRIELLAGQAPIDSTARDEIAELRETLSSLGASLDELADQRAHGTEQVDVAVAELGARIDDLALRVTEGRTEADEALRAELGELAARVEESDAAGVVARDESRAELERVAASIAWRLERVEEALSADDRDAVRQALAEVAQRLEAQEGRQEEQVRVTERALRKGLASLGDRLADGEAEYVRAGNALRRSIERLGSAIIEADVATAERSSDETLALHHANATSYVAFAPTADGYRLVAVDGSPPQVGTRLELPQCSGELVVTRLGASPIPLDTRPCAYLERA